MKQYVRLYKNKKTKPTHPDFRGEWKGVKVTGWWDTAKGGEKFINILIETEDQQDLETQVKEIIEKNYQ